MAMRTNGHLIDDEVEVEKRFKLVPAARMKAEEITKLKPHLEDLWDNNDRLMAAIIALHLSWFWTPQTPPSTSITSLITVKCPRLYPRSEKG